MKGLIFKHSYAIAISKDQANVLAAAEYTGLSRDRIAHR